MIKRFLFILQRPPHASLHVQEMLDVILTTAAFEQNVSLLFLDQGIFLLKQDQRPEVLGRKNLAPILDALSVYDIDDLYIEQESLTERGVSAGQLLLPVQVLPRAEVGALIGSYDVVGNC